MAHADSYIAYTHRFFDKWSPAYDLFALPIFYVYAAAARRTVPRPGRRILDLCTGTGEMAVRCARQGAQVVAVDITPSMLARAQRKAALPIRFELMDARQLAFADASFDVTVLSFALHDMPRRVALEVLAEASRVTRERLVIVDYRFPRLPLLQGLLRWLIGLYETAYLPRFARQGGVASLISEAGMVASAKSSFWLPLFGIDVVAVGPEAET